MKTLKTKSEVLKKGSSVKKVTAEFYFTMN